MTNARALIAAIFLLVTSPTVRADVINVDGTNLTLRTPIGYCTATDDAVLGPRNEMLRSAHIKNILLAAPCDDLNAFRTGASSMLKTFMTWSVTISDNGTASKLPPTMTKSALVLNLAKTMSKFDSSAIIADANKKLKDNDIGIQLKIRTRVFSSKNLM